MRNLFQRIDREKAKNFFSNRTNVILVVVLSLIVLTALFFGIRFLTSEDNTPGEFDLSFNAEGPYAILNPRYDGHALILNLYRVSSYDAINYELVYQSIGSGGEEGTEAIDRGVTGNLNTKDKKNEYSQEILFGTCSKGDTFSTLHCVFDKNVENGTLTLKIQKGKRVYKMPISWHLQTPKLVNGILASVDGHFSYKTSFSSDIDPALESVQYTIINELTGVPKLPTGKEVLGKVYTLNIPSAKDYPGGEVRIELAENAPSGAQIARFNEKDNKWDMFETKVDKSVLTASTPGTGIFAVLVSAK